MPSDKGTVELADNGGGDGADTVDRGWSGTVPRTAPETMATAIVSPSALARPSTEAPIMPALTQGRLTFRATSQSFIPSASAPSFGRPGTWRSRSRVVAATIGTIMMASTRPAVSKPSPEPVVAAEEIEHGHVG